MSNSDTIRKEVSLSYAKAVSTPATDGGCCGGTATSKGVAAKLAGYTAEEINALPTEAVVNSFGCGNPVAFSGVKPGDVVIIPPMQRQRITNTGAGDLIFLAICNPRFTDACYESVD